MKLASCVIDFTVHRFSVAVVEAALRNGKALVMGTTGHTDEELAVIHAASKSIPIVHAPNFSVGVNTLFWLTQQAARILKQDTFDIEVTEMHHRHKIDAPSGTARRLLEILNKETGTSYNDDIAHGRFGNIGPRTPREIGMHTLRGGDVVGDHTVMFAADGERVELTHKASSRMTFATGAVRAALWLENKAPGLYDMQDVLELK
jgi:4-hydroxy-tetrahydrodipicolinate reductase